MSNRVNDTCYGYTSHYKISVKISTLLTPSFIIIERGPVLQTDDLNPSTYCNYRKLSRQSHLVTS